MQINHGIVTGDKEIRRFQIGSDAEKLKRFLYAERREPVRGAGATGGMGGESLRLPALRPS